MWQQTWKRSFQTSIKRFACPFPERVFPVADRQLADTPRSAINAFQHGDGEPIYESAQENAASTMPHPKRRLGARLD
jgi:hypothetical protein